MAGNVDHFLTTEDASKTRQKTDPPTFGLIILSKKKKTCQGG